MEFLGTFRLERDEHFEDILKELGEKLKHKSIKFLLFDALFVT
jgi:hypothetical protein